MKKEDKLKQFRFDFSMEVLSMDKETGIVHFALKPNPERYEEYEENGKRYYRDKYLNLVYSEDILRQMAEQSVGKPGYFNPPIIDDSLSYSNERKVAIDDELQTGVYQAPKNKPSEHVSIETADLTKELVFISVDVCKSTELRVKYPDKFDKALELLIKELGTVIGLFHGSILKLTGDGFIAYIEYPSTITMCDNALDMCLTMLLVLQNSLNPNFIKNGIPRLSIRIGADIGTATMHEYNVPTTGFKYADVTSDALNRAVKIQETAKPNQFLIGTSLYEGIHINWLKRCSPVTQDISIEIGINDYRLYEVN